MLRERVRVLEAADEDEQRRTAAATMAGAARSIAGSAAAGALFDACDGLSGEAYEQGDAHGSLLLCARGHPSVDVLLELTEPVPLQRTRSARKALELSRGEVAPLCDGTVLWGLGRVARPYDPARADLLEVRFAGRSRWELRHGGEVLFAVQGHHPRPAPALARDRLEVAARTVLGGSAGADLAALWLAASSVVAAGRGSTLVVTVAAAAEARRLAAQGTPIAPRVLEPDALQAATGIGGAILLDPSGVCHAIGVILDGVATGQGERSRGSRYNTAAAYVRGRRGALAVVVSDDGAVDLLGG